MIENKVTITLQKCPNCPHIHKDLIMTRAVSDVEYTKGKSYLRGRCPDRNTLLLLEEKNNKYIPICTERTKY